MLAPVRQPRQTDDLAPLLYAASADLYDLYYGGRSRALAALRRDLWRRGHASSFEICLVGGEDEPVGVLAGFPSVEYERRSRHGQLLALRRIPPWRWRGPWLTARIEGMGDLTPPLGSWYVDSLAVAPARRRQGIATALLVEAERRARQAGCSWLAVDTAENNRPARRLYESQGMSVHRRAPVPPRTRALGIPVTGWVAYSKAL